MFVKHRNTLRRKDKFSKEGVEKRRRKSLRAGRYRITYGRYPLSILVHILRDTGHSPHSTLHTPAPPAVSWSCPGGARCVPPRLCVTSQFWRMLARPAVPASVIPRRHRSSAPTCHKDTAGRPGADARTHNSQFFLRYCTTVNVTGCQMTYK